MSTSFLQCSLLYILSLALICSDDQPHGVDAQQDSALKIFSFSLFEVLVSICLPLILVVVANAIFLSQLSKFLTFVVIFSIYISCFINFQTQTCIEML